MHSYVAVGNLSDLRCINENSILENLAIRKANSKPYCAAGPYLRILLYPHNRRLQEIEYYFQLPSCEKNYHMYGLVDSLLYLKNDKVSLVRSVSFKGRSDSGKSTAFFNIIK